MLGYGAIGQFTIAQGSARIGPILQPWTEPPKPKIKAALAIALIASGLFSPVIQPPSTTITVDRWYRSFTDPIRKPNLRATAQAAFTVKAAPFPETIFPDKWFVPFTN